MECQVSYSIYLNDVRSIHPAADQTKKHAVLISNLQVVITVLKTKHQFSHVTYGIF